jgi:sugar O-acyltransferase (sialic acid O-acetyltransferase NeuD family)
MEKKEVIMLGGGGHAKVLADAISELPNYSLIGFLDDNESLTQLLGVSRIGKLTTPPQDTHTKNVIMGIGHIGRLDFYKKCIGLFKDLGYTFETILTKNSVVSKRATIGIGSIVMNGAVIQVESKIGDHVIVNTNASIDHGSTVGDYTHIAPGCSISGDVTIGKNCLIGTGASIIQGITIVDNCIIGADSVVVKDCLEPGTYVGVPAKKIK